MADKLVKNKVLAALESVSGPTATMWDGETEYFKSLQFGGGDVLYPLPIVDSTNDNYFLMIKNGSWTPVKILIKYSGGGKEFNNTSLNFTPTLIASNDKIFVASSSEGGIYYSSIDDSLTWNITNLKTEKFNNIKYEFSMWVATSSDGFYYSSDGKNWQKSESEGGAIAGLLDVNGQGWWCANGTKIYNSYDGKSWNSFDLKSKFQYIQIINDLKVDGSKTYVSVRNADGDERGVIYNDGGLYTWTRDWSLYTLNNLFYTKVVWVASSYNFDGLFYSVDGKTYVQSNITSKFGLEVTFCASDDTIIAGYNGGNSSFYSPVYYSIDNGRTWTASNLTSGKLIDCYYNGNLFICIFFDSLENKRCIYYSKDGIIWLKADIANSSENIGSNICYGNNVWLISGDNKNLYYSKADELLVFNNAEGKSNTILLQ